MQRKTTALLTVNYFYWFVLIVLTVLIAVKSFLLPVTNDEAYSFFLIKTNYWKAMAGTANTHWLNSFFIRVFTFLFGNEPWMWRVQSVLAGAGYLFIAKKIAGSFDTVAMQLICFSLLVFNPYLLDYFSMARGYGLSAFFILLSVYFLQQFYSKHKERYFFACFVSLSAAVISNYTSLYFFLSSALLLTLFLVLKKGGIVKGIFKSGLFTRTWLIAVAISFIAIANLFFIKYYTSDLEFGSDHSFARDTFGSMLQYSAYLVFNETMAAVLGYVLLLSILLLSSIIIKRTYPDRPVAETWIASALLLTIGLSTLFFYLLKNPYIVERGALVFFPVVILILCKGVTFLQRSFSEKLSRMILGVLSFLFVLNTAFNYKLTSTLDWKENTDTPLMLNDIKKMSGVNTSIKVGMHRVHYGVFKNYYSVVTDQFKDWDVLFLSDEELLHPNQNTVNKLNDLDFVISSIKTNPALFNNDSSKYILVKQYRLGGDILLRRK